MTSRCLKYVYIVATQKSGGSGKTALRYFRCSMVFLRNKSSFCTKDCALYYLPKSLHPLLMKKGIYMEFTLTLRECDRRGKMLMLTLTGTSYWKYQRKRRIEI